MNDIKSVLEFNLEFAQRKAKLPLKILYQIFSVRRNTKQLSFSKIL